MLSDCPIKQDSHSERQRYGYCTRCKNLGTLGKIQGDDERILFIVGGPGSGKSLLIRELYLSRRAGNT